MSEKLDERPWLYGGVAWAMLFTALTLVDHYLFGLPNYEKMSGITSGLVLLIWFGPTIWMFGKADKIVGHKIKNNGGS